MTHKQAKREVDQERSELQQNLEDAEACVEAEEAKYLRVTVELQQVKQEIDRKLAEKEEEYENARRNTARSVEQIQVSSYQVVRNLGTCPKKYSKIGQSCATPNLYFRQLSIKKSDRGLRLFEVARKWRPISMIWKFHWRPHSAMPTNRRRRPKI